jgi:hypothetical protein
MTDLPRPSELGLEASIEDLVRSARAHGIELPYRVSLPEDHEADPDMRLVTFRRQGGEMTLPYSGGRQGREIEMTEGDDDGGAWRVIYHRVPDPFRDIYQEVHRERLPEPDPAIAGQLAAELDAIHREWVANDGLSELTRRRMRGFPLQ